MCVCVCVCMCVYACMHVCMYVRMYACMHACMHERMYACMCVCMYVRMHVRMHVCKHVNKRCMYACTYACMHACKQKTPCVHVKKPGKPTPRAKPLSSNSHNRAALCVHACGMWACHLACVCVHARACERVCASARAGMCASG